MKVSKHHYALALAAINCKIYFIEPPKLSNKGIVITPSPEHENISIVSFKPLFRGKRFLPKYLFEKLIQLQIKEIVRKIGVKPDVVWNFSSHLFLNLNWFDAPVKIMLVADIANENPVSREVHTADFVLAVSDKIYTYLKGVKNNIYQISHGLQDLFLMHAQKLLEQEIQLNLPVKSVGYSGNLRMDGLDRNTITTVIKAHPELDFVFWGSYEKKDLNLGGSDSDELNSFIHFLKSQKNVSLRGVVNTEQLNKEMNDVQVFWLCLDIKKRDCSNSHKIVEYLSFGKPIIANNVSSYKNTNLLYMLESDDNKEYLNLFDSSIKQINDGETRDMITKRIKFAIKNSYAANLIKIENLINTEHGF